MRTYIFVSCLATLIAAAPFSKTNHIVPLKVYPDGNYYATITIGLPAVRYQVAVDTTDTLTWVVGYNCRYERCKGVPTQKNGNFIKSKYDPMESAASVDTPHDFKRSPDHRGHIWEDELIVANISIWGQNFGAAASITPAFAELPADGSLGLLLTDWSGKEGAPILQALFTHMSDQRFTIWLQDNADDGTSGSIGQLTFEALDEEHCTETFIYHKTVRYDVWQWDISSLAIGKFTDARKRRIAIDTSTPYIHMPKPVLEQAVKQLGAVFDQTQNIYTVACAKTKESPALTFNLEEETYTIPAKYYILNTGLDKGACQVMLAQTLSQDFDYAFGAPLQRAYCNVFHFGWEKVAFSPRK